MNDKPCDQLSVQTGIECELLMAVLKWGVSHVELGPPASSDFEHSVEWAGETSLFSAIEPNLLAVADLDP
jgi:hypothetical protein